MKKALSEKQLVIKENGLWRMDILLYLVGLRGDGLFKDYVLLDLLPSINDTIIVFGRSGCIFILPLLTVKIVF